VLEQSAALAAQAFRHVFLGTAGTLAVSFLAILLLEEKPLQTSAAAERG
jgi:hypothetical protein